MKKYKAEFKEQVINFYKQQPTTIKNVANIFQISNPTLIKWLKEAGITPYTKSKLFSPNLIEDYFENIDSATKAYFLGLILTDGNIHYPKDKNTPIVSLSLKLSDSYLLSLFKEEIKSNKQVCSDGKGSMQIQIHSQKMVDDLSKYGITERKSKVISFPENIPIKFFPDFIRGIFDGNGSSGFYGRKGRFCHKKLLRICSASESFIDNLMDALLKYDIVGKKRKELDGTWQVYYSTNNSLYNLIVFIYYSEDIIFLKRKKDICDQILNEVLYYKHCA